MTRKNRNASDTTSNQPWHVQAKRGGGSWKSIPGEQYARRERADHRRHLFSSMVDNASFRVVKITNLPREEEN